MSKNDIVLPKKRRYYFQTLEQHFLHGSFALPNDIEALRAAIASISPEYLQSFDKVMAQRSGHMFNMFIMKRSLLDEYCHWLFDVLAELDTHIEADRTRIIGYFAEHMLDIWVLHHSLAYEECSTLNLDAGNEIARRIGFLVRLFGQKDLSDRIVKRAK